MAIGQVKWVTRLDFLLLGVGFGSGFLGLGLGMSFNVLTQNGFRMGLVSGAQPSPPPSCLIYLSLSYDTQNLCTTVVSVPLFFSFSGYISKSDVL